MKEEVRPLKIFNFSSSLMNTEVYSLFGHKYLKSLSFAIELVKDLESANLILWDGIVTAKNGAAVKKIIESLGSHRRLLVLSDSKTLWSQHTEFPQDFVEELNAWTVLPEELLFAFETNYKKLTHA